MTQTAKRSRPDHYWHDVKRLLEKHKTLTTGDVATLSGMDIIQARNYMRHARAKGAVTSSQIKGKIIGWSLP